MRITFVGPVPPLQGGISQHSARLIEALVSTGHRVDVISWRDQYPRLLYRGAQRIAGSPGFPNAKFLLRWWSPASWWSVRRQASKSDLLVLPYVTPFLAIPQRIIAGGAKSVTAVVHNVHPHEKMPFENILACMILRRADRLVAHGSGVAEDLRTMGLLAPISVVDMPPTLEVTPTPLPVTPPMRLLFFGFVRPYKGLNIAIEAVGRLADLGHEAKLTVLGEFWEPIDNHQRVIDDLGLTERVDLRPGYASDAELREALSSHHLVVAPYVSDTLSAVVPVAFGAGRTVVSTRVAGISEQVRHDIDGVLVAPGDAVAFAAGILKAFDRLVDLTKGAVAASATWADVAASITSSPGIASDRKRNTDG